MSAMWWALAWSVGLLLGMLACLDAGFRVAQRAARKRAGPIHEGVGAMEAAVFALLGLLLGFSFAGGTSRLDSRRQLIVQEANAIGTAYLRVDLLPLSEQAQLRHLFHEYIDNRLIAYRSDSVQRDTDALFARSEQLQREIWAQAKRSSAADTTQNSARLLLPAINDMIDVTAARTVAFHTELPPLIFGLLVVVALLSSLLAGYAMEHRGRRSWLHMFVYAAAVSSTVYVVLDLDNPSFGWIHLQAADHALVQVGELIRNMDGATPR